MADTFMEQYEEALNRFQTKTKVAQQAERVAEAKPAKAPPLLAEPDDNVPADWVPFSQVFGFAPPSGWDRKGPVHQPSDFSAGLAGFIPKVKPAYYLPAEETEALWHAYIDGDVVWLHGLSGTGKSSLEEQFAARVGQPFLRFNGREDVESGALFGQLTVEAGENGGTVWKDGLLTEGVRYGARVLLDEATLIPSGIMMGVQWLLEEDGKLMLTDKPATAGERLVTPDPRFRLTFADNTTGQGDNNGLFTGTGIMNTATLNRVGLTLEIDYLPPLHEAKVLAEAHPKVHARVIETVTSLAHLLRKAMKEGQISLAFSLRTEHSMLRKAVNYRYKGAIPALRRAFDEAYTNLLPSEDERQASINFFDLTIGGL
jgi:cobaltochelatase CobS